MAQEERLADEARPFRRPLVTPADRARWQRQGARELAAILDEHLDLPVIAWKVGITGGLEGQVIAVNSDEDTRAVFTAWQQALRLGGIREDPLGDSGVTHLRAHTFRGSVHISVTANVYPDDAIPAGSARVARPGSQAQISPRLSEPTPGGGQGTLPEVRRPGDPASGAVPQW